MDDARTGARRRRRARRRRPDRGGRARPGRARGHRRDRRPRRHRHAGHDRHPPAHVADRDARLRRRLDAHPVLRLVLPRARQALPARRTSTPATCSPAIESLDAGVTTTVDWSHGLQTTEHADAAVDALQAVPGRFVLAYGNIQPAPWEWATPPDFRDFVRRRITPADDMLGFQMAFDVTGDPAFPEQRGVRGGPRPRRRRSPRTPASGARPTTTASGSCTRTASSTPQTSTCTPRRCRPTPTTGSPPPAARCRSRPRASRAPGRATRPPGRCARTTSRCRCRWTPASGGAATCSPRCAPRSAPTAPASTSRRTPRATRSPTATCAPSRSSSGRPAAARARSASTASSAASRPGKKADVVLIKNDHSPVMFPLLNPYGHVAFQAQRGDVHTVLVNGRVVKRDHRLVGVDLAAAPPRVEATVEHLRSTLGRGGLGAGHEPGRPRDRDPRQPLHLHRVPQREHARPLTRRPDGRPVPIIRLPVPPRSLPDHGAAADGLLWLVLGRGGAGTLLQAHPGMRARLRHRPAVGRTPGRLGLCRPAFPRPRADQERHLAQRRWRVSPTVLPGPPAIGSPGSTRSVRGHHGCPGSLDRLAAEEERAGDREHGEHGGHDERLVHPARGRSTRDAPGRRARPRGRSAR